MMPKMEDWMVCKTEGTTPPQSSGVSDVMPDLPMPKRLRAGRPDPASILNSWIPAGVYPVLDTGLE
jgi:hypothetical protein